MRAVDNVKCSRCGYFHGGALSGIFEKSVVAEHRTELLWPFVAGDLPSQRFQPRAVAAGQYNRPFVISMFRACFQSLFNHAHSLLVAGNLAIACEFRVSER
jgi:hypothetical protein